MRQEVFESGDFYDWREESIEELEKASPEEAARLLHIEQDNPYRTDPVHSVEEWIAQMQVERTSLALIHRNEIGSGTHTVIDMTRLVEVIQEDGDIAPIPPDYLMSFLGTTQPDHATCMEHLSDLMRIYPRWNGGYISVYNHDQPTEILFCGHSGT